MDNPLTTDQTAAFRKRLRDRRTELLASIRQALLQSDNERYIELAGAVHDSAEESVADQLSEMANALIGRQVNEVREVEDALQRIAVGSYGVCVECGKPVELERLEVYPAARRCFLCQSRYEKSHAGPAKPSL
jgi:DnaK suppressor protein